MSSRWYNDWTTEREAELKRLWADGLSASQIAARLGGVTRNAVIGKVHRLGIPKRSKASRVTRRAPKMVAKTGGNVKPPEPKPQPLPDPEPEPIAAEEETACTLMELADERCRWPIGDVGEPGFHFCGARTGEGVYCPAHARKAYQPFSSINDQRRTA